MGKGDFKLRIGVDGRELLKGEKTGIGRFTEIFLKEILELKKDWIFIVFGNQYSDFKEFKKYSNFKSVLVKENIRILWDQHILLKYLGKEKIDLFFSPYHKFPLLTKIPKIIIVHDVIPFVFKKYRRKNLFLKYLYSLYLKKADLIITPSCFSKEKILEVFNVEEEKTKVVYEWINPVFKKREKKEIEEVKNKYGINKEYILYVGNLNPHKNVNILIEAYHELPMTLEEKYQLVIVGGKLNIESALFIDYVDDYELSCIYSGASVFVFPSFIEGFGLPPLEAMASGLPVIASRSGANEEIVDDNENGYLFSDLLDLVEKVSILIKNENLKKKFSFKGKEKVRKFFPIERTIKEILDIYTNLISR